MRLVKLGSLFLLAMHPCSLKAAAVCQTQLLYDSFVLNVAFIVKQLRFFFVFFYGEIKNVFLNAKQKGYPVFSVISEFFKDLE